MITEMICSLVISTLCGILFGHIFARLLPEISPVLDRKPFNCAPCSSFHITWILAGISALVLEEVIVFAWGVVIAFGVYAVVKYIDNQKIEK